MACVQCTVHGTIKVKSMWNMGLRTIKESKDYKQPESMDYKHQDPKQDQRGS